MSSPMLPRANELPFKAEFVITKHALPSVSLTPTFKADQQRDWWVKSCHLKGSYQRLYAFSVKEFNGIYMVWKLF